MTEPWDRVVWRVGLKLGTRTGTQPSAMLGWAAIELSRPPVLAKGTIGAGDPDELLTEALMRARQAMMDGAECVTLYRYASDRAYADSRDAAEGGNRRVHRARVDRLAAALRAENIPVRIEVIQ